MIADDDEVTIPGNMSLEIIFHEKGLAGNINVATSSLLDKCSDVVCCNCKHSKFRLGFGFERDEIFYMTGNFFCAVFLKNIVPYRCALGNDDRKNVVFFEPGIFDTTFGCGAYEEPEKPSKLDQAAKLLDKR